VSFDTPGDWGCGNRPGRSSPRSSPDCEHCRQRPDQPAQPEPDPKRPGTRHPEATSRPQAHPIPAREHRSRSKTADAAISGAICGIRV
jgi:hypothetical protein